MVLVSLYTLSVLVATLFVLIVIFLRKRFDHFSNRGLPHVKPSWKLLFNMFHPATFFNAPFEIYDAEKDGNNSIMGFYSMFLAPSIVVVDPSMVQKICIKDFSYFHDHMMEFDFSRDPLAGHLFNLTGEKWRALRMKLLPTYTSGKLKGMIPDMEICAQSVIKEMKTDSTLRQDINLKDLFKKFAVSVIATCAFGIDPESVKDPNCEYQRSVLRVVQPPKFDQFKMFFVFVFPKIAKFFNMKLFPVEVDNFFLNLTRDTMEMRKNSGVKRNDFVQLLLELKEKGSVQIDNKDLEEDEKQLLNQQQQLTQSESTSKLEMTHEVLTAQSFLFIVAGIDNSSYLVAITAYMLSKNRDILHKVREEVRAAKNKHGGINYDSLRDMKLLDASINEALRIHPSLYVLFRMCTKDYKLSEGMTVDKGTMVFIPAKSLQNDSKYWRNPEQFNPERFLTDTIHPGTYMPFGEGPRLCIAQRLALLMGKVMLSELIDNFDIFPSDKTQEPLRPKLMAVSDVQGGLWGSFQTLNQ